jgi:hypothetical protein
MMAGLVVLGTVLGFVLGGSRAGMGVLFGGVLSFVNYLWLDRSTRGMLGEPTPMATTGILAMKYFLRYAAVLGVLVLVFWTDILPVTAVILGLSAFAFAVVAEGLKSIFSKPL